MRRRRDPLPGPAGLYFKTPIAGLYLGGASTFPGAGVEAVVISAVIAADDICPGSARLVAPALAGA